MSESVDLKEGDLILTRDNNLFIITPGADSHTWIVADFPRMSATLILDITELRAAMETVYRQV